MVGFLLKQRLAKKQGLGESSCGRVPSPSGFWVTQAVLLKPPPPAPVANAELSGGFSVLCLALLVCLRSSNS